MAPVSLEIWNPAGKWEGVGLGAKLGYRPYNFHAKDNPCWKYEVEGEWMPWLEANKGNCTIVPLQRNTSKSFVQNVYDTVNANPGRPVIDLSNSFGVEEWFDITEILKIGTGSNDLYAYGLWHSRLAGFVSLHGPDKTHIRLKAGAISQAQLDLMATLPKSTFSPMALGVIRLDGVASAGNRLLLGGIDFCAEDQGPITAVHSEMTDNNPAGEVPVFTPQPAPHNGLVVYPESTTYMSNCRFRGFGRAVVPQPPFECSNFSTQYGYTYIRKTEFDGRLAFEVDPATPRRCNPIMLNNEYYHELVDVHIHDGNISRYAANDQNRDTNSTYILRRFKAERLSDNYNTDPAINGGNTLGGWSPATLFGWESSRAQITVEDGIVIQGNSSTLNGQKPAHFQMTDVGSPQIRRQGGRFKLRNIEWHNPGAPDIDEYLIIRVGNTSYWKSDGYSTTYDIQNKDGKTLQAYEYTGTFPPTKAQLVALNKLPDTHYLVVLA